MPSARVKWKNNPDNQAGFTLFELLISIVLVSIILTIMFGAMRLGLRAWEKGEADAGSGHRIRIVKTQIKQQMASMCIRKLLTTDAGLEPVAFGLKGTQDSMEFISEYSIAPDTRMKPVYVRYGVQRADTDNLTLFEKEIITLKYEELQDFQPADPAGRIHVLLQDIGDVGFEYLKTDIDGTSQWQDSWGVGLEKIPAFPTAVKISFVFDSTPVSFVVKIMGEHESEQIN